MLVVKGRTALSRLGNNSVYGLKKPMLTTVRMQTPASGVKDCAMWLRLEIDHSHVESEVIDNQKNSWSRLWKHCPQS